MTAGRGIGIGRLESRRRLGEDRAQRRKKQRVGKFLRARPTERLKDGKELPRIVSHASDDAVDFGAEATAYPGELQPRTNLARR